jgi:hypothetical protein
MKLTAEYLKDLGVAPGRRPPLVQHAAYDPLRPAAADVDPLAAIFASIKRAARADRLSDDDIEADASPTMPKVVFDASAIVLDQLNGELGPRACAGCA